MYKSLPDRDCNSGGDRDVLKNNHNLGGKQQTPARKKRGPKIPAGKRINTLDDETKENTVEEINQPIDFQQPCSSNDLSNDSVWFCGSCQRKWFHESDDVWIQCDQCDIPFHLQCSGFDYIKDEYYDLDIEAIAFICKRCIPDNSSSDEE